MFAIFGTFSTLASASQTHRFERYLAGMEGSPLTAGGLAVDQSNGDVYAARRSEQSPTILRFDPGGAPAPFSFAASYLSGNQIVGTPSGPFPEFSEPSVAVAPPGAMGGTAGDLYVVTNTAVSIYASSGRFLGRITEADGINFGGAREGSLSPCGVAVGSTGDLYVSGEEFGTDRGAIARFAPTANPPTASSYDSSVIGFPYRPCAVAASDDTLYAGGPVHHGPTFSVPLSVFPGGGGTFDASAVMSEVTVGARPERAEAIAADPANGNFYLDGELKEPVVFGLASGAWTPREATVPDGRGVSCPAQGFCMVVGGGLRSDVYRAGVSEEIQMPAPAGASDAVLQQVSCPTISSCMAVGWSREGLTKSALAEWWNGTSWSVVAVPEPSDAVGPVIASGISCPTESSCELVGHYVSSLNPDEGPGEEKALAEIWDGTSWTVQPTPATGEAFARLNAVSCSAVGVCTAVGNRRPGFFSTESHTLAERLETSVWAIEVTSDPAEENSLDGVSCPAANLCVAVGGEKAANNPVWRGIAEIWNGAGWTESPRSEFVGTETALEGISCLGTSSCTSVAGTNTQAFITEWDGSGWATQAPPTVENASEVGLTAISCAGLGECLAVGGRYTVVELAQLSPDGSTVSLFGASVALSGSRSIAVDSSEGAIGARHVYAEASDGSRVGVAIFGPQIAIADPVTGNPSVIAGDGATLRGTVDPDGLVLADCHFAYGLTASYESTAPCEEPGFGEVGSGHEPKPVQAAIGGLNGGTAYHFRLVVANANGSSEGVDREFTTKGPGIGATSVAQKTDSGARLEAKVDPRGEETTYRFQYVTEGQFDESGFAQAIEAPSGGQQIGSGTGDVVVSQVISGLSPLSTYRFRIVASSPGGTDVGPGQSFTTYPSSAPVSTDCSNESVRALGPSLALPDCRAYEQATPVQKGGNSPQGEHMSIEASADGERVTYFVNGGFPGGESAQEFPSYLSRRSADGTGWATQGLLPSAATGPKGKVLGWDGELMNAYDGNRVQEGIATLYQRHSADAGLTALAKGSESTAPTSFKLADATSGGNYVLFEEKGDELVPGAAANASNLYLWSQSQGLQLAGVLNTRKAPTEGATAGPYDWFFGGQPGGAGGLYYTMAEHVLAPEGSAVFFTAAGSGRVYERINPTQPQSPVSGTHCTKAADACTIEISASQKTNGEGPAGVDPNGPQLAAFIGASADGSSSFLTSAEELTDDANTGAVAIGRSNTDGSSIERDFLPADATGIAVDRGHIYWANALTGSIGRASIDGSDREPKFITGASNPQGVAVDGGHIYWTNANQGVNAEGTIGRANLDGTGVDESFITGASNPQGIAVDGEYIVWANAGSTAATQRLSLASLAGTEVRPGFLTISGSSGPSGVVIQGAYAYWTNPASGTIGRVNLATDAEANPELVTGAPQPVGIAADAEGLYWASSVNGTIGRAGLGGEEPEESFVTGIGNPHALAVDGSHLFWGANEGDRGADLYRFDSGSGQLTDLTPDAVDQNGAEVKGVLGISGDGSYVYFVAAGKLTADAPAATCTGTGQNVRGRCDLYLWHAGALTFISQLESNESNRRVSDYTDWAPAAKFGNDGIQESTARLSADGRILVFRSRLSLADYDSHHMPEFYRSVNGGAPECLTCNPSGTAPVGSASLQSIQPRLVGPKIPSAILTRNLSSDGTRFFFDSPDKLVPADVNGDAGCERVGSNEDWSCEDVYEWEAPGSGSCHSSAQNGGCIYLISSGTGAEPSNFLDAGSSGRDVFFFTGQPLVGQDKDQLTDVYDARELGGISSQSPQESSACNGEGCKGVAPGTSAPVSPGSSTYVGPGNPPKPTSSCLKAKKHAVKGRKPRCVKPKHHRKRHNARPAKHHRKHTRRHRKSGQKKGDHR